MGSLLALEALPASWSGQWQTDFMKLRRKAGESQRPCDEHAKNTVHRGSKPMDGGGDDDDEEEKEEDDDDDDDDEDDDEDEDEDDEED